jgi:nucleotide-binding universal stress UspA family protein
MTIAKDGNSEQCEKYLNELSEIFNQEEIITKVVEDEKVGDAILDEAKKDYDLLVIGATEHNSDRAHLFSSVIDYLVRVSPCPTLVVNATKADNNWNPNRILIPTNGALPAKNAADFGFALAKSDPNREVSILNVVFKEESSSYHVRTDLDTDMEKFGHEIVNELKELGKTMNVKTSAAVERGESSEKVIADFARRNAIDLIILGTNIRPGSSRLYLGPRTESILANAPCPVVILNT